MERGINPQLGLTLLRVVLGVTYLAHGIPKLMGGIGGTTEFLAGLGIPLAGLVAWGITLLEVLGGLGLILGLLVTPIALLLSVEMLAGIVLVHARNGWYVLGGGTGGVEFNVVLIASLLMLVFGGPGLAAIDARRGT